jgi:hypothetical protein
MNINIFFIHPDGTGSLIETAVATDDAAAVAYIQAKKDQDGNNYSVETATETGDRVIGQV